MGYGTRPNSYGGEIKTFWPDNTQKELFIESDFTSIDLTELFDKITEHFGEGFSIDRFEISAERFHTDCLGYDLYDSGDYTNFIVIRLKDA